MSGRLAALLGCSGTSLPDNEVNVEPVLDTPEAIAIFTELEARVRKFQLQQAGGDEKGEDSGNDQEGPAASPESDDVDEGGIDEGERLPAPCRACSWLQVLRFRSCLRKVTTSCID